LLLQPCQVLENAPDAADLQDTAVLLLLLLQQGRPLRL
jgi:hypothetical protein